MNSDITVLLCQRSEQQPGSPTCPKVTKVTNTGCQEKSNMYLLEHANDDMSTLSCCMMILSYDRYRLFYGTGYAMTLIMLYTCSMTDPPVHTACMLLIKDDSCTVPTVCSYHHSKDYRAGYATVATIQAMMQAML